MKRFSIIIYIKKMRGDPSSGH